MLSCLCNYCNKRELPKMAAPFSFPPFLIEATAFVYIYASASMQIAHRIASSLELPTCQDNVEKKQRMRMGFIIKRYWA
jgi:hypothetical protein